MKRHLTNDELECGASSTSLGAEYARLQADLAEAVSLLEQYVTPFGGPIEWKDLNEQTRAFLARQP